MLLPPLKDLLDSAVEFHVPLRVRFRGVDHREGLLVHGPAGWGEFAPFPEYGPRESARWLAAAIEAAWVGWPPPVRSMVPVNAVVPAVNPATAARLVAESGCSTAKVKVAEPGQTLEDDISRVAAVRAALGPSGRIRLDANGAWSPLVAAEALRGLEGFGLEYVEQPCPTVADCARLRAMVDIPVALDEGLRKAPDPRRVEQLRDGADLLVLKVAPLGGVRAAMEVCAAYGLACVVSSALDTSVGLSAGLALAGALPELRFACGLGSGLLLSADVSAHRLLPVEGWLPVRAVRDVEGGTAPTVPWLARLSAAHAVLARPRSSPDPGSAR